MRRRDPVPAFRFRVEIEGIDVAGFQEATGLEAELEVHEYREGGRNDFVHKLPGAVRYPSNLVLRRGIADSEALWRWCERSLDGIEGRVSRRTVDVVLLDAAARERRRWTFYGAYPVKWTGPQLRAETEEVALESLELAHRGLDRSLVTRSSGAWLDVSVDWGLEVSVDLDLDLGVDVSADFEL